MIGPGGAESLRPIAAATLHRTMSARQWPEVPEEHRWTIELMEERLERTTQTPEELLARAKQLRADAAETDIRGLREAALALAERYEEAAADRVASA